MNPSVVVIESSHFDYRNNNKWTDSNTYAAYRIKKEWTSPKVVHLFEHQQLKGFLSKKNQTNYMPPEELLLDNGTAVLFADSIYNQVWQKLEQELVGAKTIYYATGGLLHQFLFAALGQTDSPSLSEQYNLVQLISTAKLVDVKNDVETEQILLVGGIDYTYDTTNSNPKQQVAYSYLENEKLKRSITNRSRGENWNYPPGTKSEIADKKLGRKLK